MSTVRQDVLHKALGELKKKKKRYKREQQELEFDNNNNNNDNIIKECIPKYPPHIQCE